jgi:ribosomal protein L10
VCAKEFFVFYFTTVLWIMAISKELKKQLIEQYVADLSAASNAIIVQQTGIPVTTATQVRKDIKSAH